MLKVRKTETFLRWIKGLKDIRAVVRIQARIDRLGMGHFGDFKTIREGVCEMRIDHGPGYRVYFKRTGQTVIVLLVGGDKSTQTKDTETAVKMAAEWSKENE
jgi:putative addiction module killer protein